MEKISKRVSVYSGHPLKVLGKCRLLCKFPNRPDTLLVFIVIESEKHAPTVIGLPSLKKLNLVAKVDSLSIKDISHQVKDPATLSMKDTLSNHKDVFEGIGCVSHYEYDIKLKEDAKPTIAACRKIPLLLQDQVKKELEMMEKEGIIRKVVEPTDWVNPIVITKKKNDNIRICIDPTELNKHIRRQHHRIPDFDDLSARLSGHKIFSTLDADRAFHQIKLSERSSYYLVITTPFGRYRYLRMPFGICSVTEVFKQCFEEVFSDIEGLDIYVDDLRIRAKN